MFSGFTDVGTAGKDCRRDGTQFKNRLSLEFRLVCSCGRGIRRWRFIERAGLAKDLNKPVEEDLRLTLFVARDVFATPRGEFSEFFPARHGCVLLERPGGGNLESLNRPDRLARVVRRFTSAATTAAHRAVARQERGLGRHLRAAEGAVMNW